MNWREFSDKYPVLSGTLAGDFHDSETVDDESNARNLRNDLSTEDRIYLLDELLADARKLMANIDADWEVMIAKANRQIYNAADARAWLMRVIDAWQEELARLRSNGSKP